MRQTLNMKSRLDLATLEKYRGLLKVGLQAVREAGRPIVRGLLLLAMMTLDKCAVYK